MRYVIYAFAAVLVAMVWLNNTSDGRRVKNKMFQPSSHATRLY